MTIIQFPNKLLWIMIVAWPMSYFSYGILHVYSRAIFISAGIMWAYEELVHGVNWFRKGLGLVVMLIFVYSIATLK